MARVSMGEVWDDTRRFVAREAALLVPLALATIGLGSVLFGLALPARDPAGMVAGAWMIALIPVALLLLLGQLAASALVLVPRASVGEALRAGAARLPGAVLASLALLVAMMALLLATGMIARLLGAALGLGAAQVATLAGVLTVPVVLWLAVRLIALLPMLAAIPPTLAVLPAIRRAFALTRGHAGPIAGALLAFFVGYLLIVAALEFAGGAALLLAGRAIGALTLGATLAAVLVALVGAGLQMVWVVFQAMLYRRLAERG